MKVLKNFNNISEELRAECIPDFGSGEIRTFRMLNGVINNDPEIDQRLKRPIFYPDTQIRTWTKIKDPFKRNDRGEVKGGFVEVGVVENFDIATETPTKFKLLVKGQNIGMFVLNGDSVDDVEMYEFLCISNENASFKYRDKTVTPLFEIVEMVDIEEETDREFDLLMEAGSALRKLSDAQKRQLAILLQLDPSLDDRTLSSKILELTKGAPSMVMDAIKHLKANSGRKGAKKEEVLA